MSKTLTKYRFEILTEPTQVPNIELNDDEEINRSISVVAVGKKV